MFERRKTIRRLMAVGAAGAVATALLGAAPAGATEESNERAHGVRSAVPRTGQTTWLDDPAVASGVGTARTQKSVTGIAQLRFGTHEGVKYGWARGLRTNDNHWVRFEVDLDGDRSWDEYESWRIGARNYTSGYPTSSSKDRAFRACVVDTYDEECVTGENGTVWW
ncbi:hypothetical protein [Actinorugispora endophytica]|uniref:Secreted protein n=1 Tax=Actinorugispora endophytica TaxID=1605990 RepID=A0A4R6VEF8_9ACTN|nr:hypothetical protein [Actinorugispora endophytica]TDQ55427.1 hypothetical protein EV190_101754 [Actinorugispora endophytica]